MSFESILEHPEDFGANQMIVRLIEGLGFRFYWATEGLREEDYSYKPSEDTMSLAELIYHLEDLATMCLESFIPVEQQEKISPSVSRENTLKKLQDLKESFQKTDQQSISEIDIKGFPIWNMINGPLADALTHVGQINTYRRLNGNPIDNISFFVGKKKSSK